MRNNTYVSGPTKRVFFFKKVEKTNAFKVDEVKNGSKEVMDEDKLFS